MRIILIKPPTTKSIVTEKPKREKKPPVFTVKRKRGRPSVETYKTKTIGCRLTDAEWDKVLSYCELHELKPAELLRQLLNKILNMK